MTAAAPAEPVRSILVVDDDLNARLIMRAALRKAGYEVLLAEGGADALRQYRARPCDLVMLDVDMPDLDGHEVCRILRAEVDPLLPVVMVTGMDDLESVQAAYDSGATDFIAKPVNWALIGHRVRYLLRMHDALLSLREAEARHAAVLDAIPDLLFEVDLDGTYLDYRAPRRELLAAPAEAFLGRTIAQVLPTAVAEVCMAALREAHHSGQSNGRQFELTLPQGSTWFELSVAHKAVAPGASPRFIMLSREITDRKQAEARIARLAYFDSLTGLPNRQSFLERVDRAIRRAGQKGERLAVLFMDLDGFKVVNDTLGHAAGDQLLRWAADRLRDGLRPTDLLSRPMGLHGAGEEALQLARLGGDEFTALLQDIDRPEDALAVAARIGELMQRPFVLDGQPVRVGASIGIALFPDDGTDAATLLKHADTAMYHAKSAGRGRAQLYSADQTAAIVERVTIERQLREALRRDEFRLVYQPVVDTTTGQVRSLEAFIRWHHPARGVLAPADFIRLAEELGLIEAIDDWVLRTACADAAGWPVGVSVNLSPLLVGKPGLAARVLRALQGSGLPPQRLGLEVTETALLADSKQARAALTALHEAGIAIVLDDFGTGYSSLAYLARMPVDAIKIDRGFVGRLLDDAESEAIVRAVLAMADSLGLGVIAESVQTPMQAQRLAALNCPVMQGFWLAAPVPAAEVPALLARDRAPALPTRDEAPRPAADRH